LVRLSVSPFFWISSGLSVDADRMSETVASLNKPLEPKIPDPDVEKVPLTVLPWAPVAAPVAGFVVLSGKLSKKLVEVGLGPGAVGLANALGSGAGSFAEEVEVGFGTGTFPLDAP
jgi:hypothetical protein